MTLITSRASCDAKNRIAIINTDTNEKMTTNTVTIRHKVQWWWQPLAIESLQPTTNTITNTITNTDTNENMIKNTDRNTDTIRQTQWWWQPRAIESLQPTANTITNTDTNCIISHGSPATVFIQDAFQC